MHSLRSVAFLAFLALAGCNLPATVQKDCPNCKGVGAIDCLGCGGTGNQKTFGAGFKETGFTECRSCRGKGTFPCGFCGGDGKTLQMETPAK